MRFSEVVTRLRSGEPQAVREFVAQYEPYIRRFIRRRIAFPNLQAVADSADVCQSALGSFFVRCAAGEYDLASRRGMENLLMTIVRRKFALLARRELNPLRHRSPNLPWKSAFAHATSSRSDPGNIAAHAELLQVIQDRLSPADRSL